MSLTINTRINGKSITWQRGSVHIAIGISARHIGIQRHEALLQHRRVRRLHGHL